MLLYYLCCINYFILYSEFVYLIFYDISSKIRSPAQCSHLRAHLQMDEPNHNMPKTHKSLQIADYRKLLSSIYYLPRSLPINYYRVDVSPFCCNAIPATLQPAVRPPTYTSTCNSRLELTISIQQTQTCQRRTSLYTLHIPIRVRFSFIPVEVKLSTRGIFYSYFFPECY